eukprot:g970.t1
MELATGIGCNILQPGPVIRDINGMIDKALSVTDAALEIRIGNSQTYIWPIVVNSRQQYRILLGMDFLSKSKAKADFSRSVYCIGGLNIRQQQDRLEVLNEAENCFTTAPLSLESVTTSWGGEESDYGIDSVPAEITVISSQGDTQRSSQTQYHTANSHSEHPTEYNDCFSEAQSNVESSADSWHDIFPFPTTVDAALSAHNIESSATIFYSVGSPNSSPRNSAVSRGLPPILDDVSSTPSPTPIEYGSAHESLSVTVERIDQELDSASNNTQQENLDEFSDALESLSVTTESNSDSEDPNPNPEATSTETHTRSTATVTTMLDPSFSSTSIEPEFETEPKSDFEIESYPSSNSGIHAFLASPDVDYISNESDNPTIGILPSTTQNVIPKEPTNKPADFLSTVDINPNLRIDQKSQLKSVLRNHADLFSEDVHTFPVCSILQHEIILKPDARPYRVQRVKRFSRAERQFIDSEVDRLLRASFIREHDGCWSAPVTVVPKKTGGYWLCVAYCGLNQRTERQSHPLPHIRDLIEAASGNRFYSNLDAQSAFHSLLLTNLSQPLTGFTTGKASYCYQRMPFGLMNAPSTFSRAIRLVLQPTEERDCVSCFMDDCCVYSCSFDRHLDDLTATLKALHVGGLRLNIHKCHFGYASVTFLGYQLSKQGIMTDSKKTDAIVRWSNPSSVTDIRRFLGLCNFYRAHIHRYAELCEPLLLLTRKSQSTFTWGKQQQDAFHALKVALSEAPVLAPPDFAKDFLLECDTSDVAVASVLSQENPVAFYSKTLSATERRYSVTDKEMLSVVSSFTHFRPYLHGSFTRCYTDHSSVVKLCKDTQNSGRRGRWADLLQEFSFSIEHRAGSTNTKADALTRSHGIDPTPNAEHSEQVTPAIIARFSSVTDDPFLTDIHHYLLTGEARGETTRQRKQIRDRSLRFVLRDNQLLYLDLDGVLKICVPTQDTQVLIAEYHNRDHWGRDLTLTAIRKLYWWRSMFRDVSEFVKKCEVCQAFGASKRVAPLQPVLTIQPLEVLELDYAGPIASTDTPYLISATCCLTRWIECKAATAPSTANATAFLQEHIFYRFGLPVCILTNRGQAFANRFTSFLRQYNIQHRRSSSEHPQTLGNEERSHGLVIQKIHQFLVEEPNTPWEGQLPRAVFTVNSRVSVSAPISPLEAMVGVTVRRPTELSLLAKIQPTEERIRAISVAGRDVEQLTNRLLRLESLQDECAILKEQRALKMKQRYDRVHKSKPSAFEIDDLVWIRRVDRIGKLESRWRGPAVVVAKNEDVYTVQLGEQEITSHANRLKPYDFFRQ